MTGKEAIDEIKEKTPKLLEDYRALAKALMPALGIADAEEDDADKPEMAPEELQELYEAILEFAEGYDQDAIGMLLQQTKDYRIPEAEKARFSKVEKAAHASDWEALREVLSA